MDKSKIYEAMQKIQDWQGLIDAEVQKVIIQLGGEDIQPEIPSGHTVVVSDWFGEEAEIVVVDRLDMTRSRGFVKETQLPCVICESDVRESDRKLYRSILDSIRSDKCWQLKSGVVGGDA